MTSPYYQDENVTLYCGDCLEHPEWWTGADVLVTDPPYGIKWTTHGVSRTSFGDRNKCDFNGTQRDVQSIANDTDTSARDHALALWGDRPAIMFGSLFKPPPRDVRHIGIYVKPLDGGALSAFGKLRRDCEAIYFLGHGEQRGRQVKTGRGALPKDQRPPTEMRSSIFGTRVRFLGTPAGLSAQCGHPHAKPGDVLEALIALCPTGVIADPFAGSGSTLVAAKLLGRKAVGVELEERYCEVAARRLSQGVLDFGEWSA
ncbi:MAG: site-specific DNA-methyltransferase [Propionibacterium sp.]|nr:site-specific DNA-methyltransferase [Propionibacterium sp.]